MKPHKIRREYKEYIGNFEFYAIVEENNFEDYELRMYVDDEPIEELSMWSLGLCKQYAYGYVKWAKLMAETISNLLR